MEIIKESRYYRSFYFFKTEKEMILTLIFFLVQVCFVSMLESSIHISHHTFQITRIYS